MLLVGLTGGIGSGKSTAAKLFAELGVTVIDADKIAKNLLNKHTVSYKAVVTHFSREILDSNKNINRQKLREIIFSNINEKVWLENLLHPLVYEELRKCVAEIKDHYCVLVIPLLLETEQQDFVDRILVVDCREALQLKRIMARDGITKEQAQLILNNQLDRRSRLKQADDIISNNETIEELKQQVLALHNQYQKL